MSRLNIMADMVRMKYIAEASTKGSTVSNVLEYNWSKLQDPKPSPLQKGTF
jgi:hypothetical protein